MSKWQIIYKTDLLYRAEIVKSHLGESLIDSIVLDKKDSAYQLGHYELLVAPDQVLRAIKIIENDITFG
ncbi:MAG: hypothetical protein ACJAT1_001970 [Marivirga sp.]|jgi:hypothetical protein